MKALVAGGAGFIGSHLCKRLIEKGLDVFCVDNLITGNLKNIKELRRSKRFHFFKADVSAPFDPRICEGGFDYIFHLASPASPNPRSPLSYLNHPFETLTVNSEGTRNLLYLSQLFGAKFLFASTSEIYGDPKVTPQREDYWGNVNPNGLRSCYDEAKRFGEALTMGYYRHFLTDVRIVRIFNTYGPKMDPKDGRVIVNFINQALKNEPITIYGTGHQTRSFCYIADLVDGLIMAMFSPNTKGEVINLGNSNEFTVLSLARQIKHLTGSSSKIVYQPLPEDDPTNRCPDLSKARELLGYSPSFSLREGLLNTIAYFSSGRV